jgi:hypothetical protein
VNGRQQKETLKEEKRKEGALRQRIIMPESGGFIIIIIAAIITARSALRLLTTSDNASPSLGCAFFAFFRNGGIKSSPQFAPKRPSYLASAGCMNCAALWPMDLQRPKG